MSDSASTSESYTHAPSVSNSISGLPSIQVSGRHLSCHHPFPFNDQPSVIPNTTPNFPDHPTSFDLDHSIETTDYLYNSVSLTSYDSGQFLFISHAAIFDSL